MFSRKKKDAIKSRAEDKRKGKKLKKPEQKVYTKTVKAKKSIDWKNMSIEEIDKNYDELKKENQELRFDLVTSHVPNIKRIRATKREIARALTYKRLRTLENRS